MTAYRPPPLGASDAPPAMPVGRRWIATAALLAWAMAIGFLRVGAAPVYIRNEAREGVYVRAMLDSGNFVLPLVPNHVENGEIIPDKPPLMHWLSAAITALRVWVTGGRVVAGPSLATRCDEWSLRAPSGLIAVLTIAAIALLGRHLVGDRAALLAAATLLASWPFVHHARFGRVDMALCGCVTLAMLWAGRALVDGVAPALLLAAAAAGLAVLAKGPLGSVLPLVACGTFVLLQSARERSLGRWRHLPWGRALVLWALVTLPWYCAALSQAGMAVLRSQIFDETIGQFIGSNARMSVFYYVAPWLQDSAPWNIVGLLGAWRARCRRDPRAMFCVVWWVSFLAVFELAAYKRQAYLLPALPAGALLAGYWLDRQLTARGGSIGSAVAGALPPWWRRALVGCLIAAVAGAVVTASGVLPSWLPADVQPVDGALGTAGLAFSVVGLLAFGRALRHRQVAAAVAAAGATQAMIFLGPVGTGELIVAQRQSPIPMVQRLARDLAPNRTVTVIGVGDDPSLPILFYFPNPANIVVVPQRAGVPAALPPGAYLLSAAVWAKVAGVDPSRPQSSGWEKRWTDTLRERGDVIPLVFAERLG